MGVLQIECLENEIVRFTVLPLYGGVLDAHFLSCHAVFKHDSTIQANPRIGWAGNRSFNVRIGKHILADFFLVICAEPQLSIHLTSKHEGTALGLPTASCCGKIQYGILL